LQRSLLRQVEGLIAPVFCLTDEHIVTTLRMLMRLMLTPTPT